MCGKIASDEGYFFMYDDSGMDAPVHFRYCSLKESVDAQYCPVDIRPSFFSITQEESQEIRPQLRGLSVKEFSALVHRSYSNVDFSSILSLMVESSIASLVLMPAGYSVALEGMTELIVSENAHTLASILDKQLARKIRSDLQAVVDGYETEISETGKKILKSKIEHTTQIPNRSKLIAPFKLLGIPLSELDEIAIEHRNSFLHGNTSLGPSGDILEANSEMLHAPCGSIPHMRFDPEIGRLRQLYLEFPQNL